MKPTSIFVVCESFEKKRKAIEVALKLGCKMIRKEKKNCLNLSIHSDGLIMDVKYDRPFVENQKKFNFDEFMQKYSKNEMIEKINQAKKQLNFNNKQLSEALGYSRQYITKMLNIPQSEKIQGKVVKEIDVLLSSKGNTVSELQKENEALKSANHKLLDQLNIAEKLHREDEKQLKDANDAIDLLNDQLNKEVESKNFVSDNLVEAKSQIRNLHQDRLVILSDFHKVKTKLYTLQWVFFLWLVVCLIYVVFYV